MQAPDSPVDSPCSSVSILQLVFAWEGDSRMKTFCELDWPSLGLAQHGDHQEVECHTASTVIPFEHWPKMLGVPGLASFIQGWSSLCKFSSAKPYYDFHTQKSKFYQLFCWLNLLVLVSIMADVNLSAILLISDFWFQWITLWWRFLMEYWTFTTVFRLWRVYLCECTHFPLFILKYFETHYHIDHHLSNRYMWVMCVISNYLGATFSKVKRIRWA